MDDGWAQALAPVADQVAQMGDFLRAEVAGGGQYLPAGERVLAAFERPFADVRVLIVGQDPYPTPGHAVGPVVLGRARRPAAAAQPAEHLPRAGRRPRRAARPRTATSPPWSDQGVLLLNRVLTVAPGASASHRGKGWEAVTDQAIRALVARGTPLVAVLWGRDAQTLRPLLGRHPRGGQRAPEPDVRRPRVLRVPPVQPGQRAAGRAGRPARRLVAGGDAPRQVRLAGWLDRGRASRSAPSGPSRSRRRGGRTSSRSCRRSASGTASTLFVLRVLAPRRRRRDARAAWAATSRTSPSRREPVTDERAGRPRARSPAGRRRAGRGARRPAAAGTRGRDPADRRPSWPGRTTC